MGLFKKFKELTFGAKIEEQMGSVRGELRFIAPELKIYKLKGKTGESFVGLEWVFSGGMSFESKPIRLTQENAGKLITFLEDAMEKTAAAPCARGILWKP